MFVGRVRTITDSSKTIKNLSVNSCEITVAGAAD
jgi:hypothetical protein